MTAPAGCLVLGTRLRSGESLPGYLVRLAARAGFDHTDRLAAMSGLRQPGFTTARSDYGHLAELAQVSIADLVAASYRPSARFAHNQFLQGNLHREMIDISARRVCPLCIREQAHHQAIWDLALISACSSHRVRLTSRCPNCAELLGWRHPSIASCRCGSEVQSWPIQFVQADEIAAAGAIGALASGSSVGWLPDPLIPCDSADLVRLVMCMGMFLSGWRRERRIETLSAAGADSVARVTVVGIQALQQWPVPLHNFLIGEAKTADMRPGRYGARKSLGSFYTWLRDVEAGPVRDALLEVTRFVIGSDPVLAQRIHRSELLAGSNAPATLVGLVKAARALKKSQASVKRLLARGQLPSVVSEGRGVPMAIDRAAVSKLMSIQSGMLTLEQLARKLNVSKARTRALLAAGHLQVAQQPREDDNGPWAIDEDIVNRWLASLENYRADNNNVPLVSFEQAARAFLHRRMGVDRLLNSVVDRDLPVAGVDHAGIGLKRLMFAKSAVQEICRAVSAGPVINLQTASRRLGVKWEMAAHLLKCGLLESLNGGVSEESVATFPERFVSGASLARALRTSSRALAVALATRGVSPITGPGVDGGRQTFYVRSEVEGARSTPVQPPTAT